MKNIYQVCVGSFDPDTPDKFVKVIKSFRHRRDAEAFIANQKNIRQFGDMKLVEQTKLKIDEPAPEDADRT